MDKTIQYKQDKIQTLVKQISQFAGVGVLATLIDFLVLYIVYELASQHYLVGSAAGFIISTLFNYSMSMRYVFQSRFERHERWKEMSIFIVLSILGLLLTQGLLYLGVDIWGLSVLPAKVGVTGCVMIFNFISRKLTLE